MKKLFLLFFMLNSLFFIDSASAQSLIGGEWRSYLDTKDNPNGVFYCLTFKSETELEFRVSTRSEANGVTLDFSYIVPGRYEFLGDEINIALDLDLCRTRLDDVTFPDEQERYYMRNPAERAEKVKEVEAVLEREKDKMTKVVPAFSTYNVIDFSDNLLMTKLNGTESFTFVRSR